MAQTDPCPAVASQRRAAEGHSHLSPPRLSSVVALMWMCVLIFTGVVLCVWRLGHTKLCFRTDATLLQCSRLSSSMRQISRDQRSSTPRPGFPPTIGCMSLCHRADIMHTACSANKLCCTEACASSTKYLER